MNLLQLLHNFDYKIALLILVAYIVVDGMYAHYTLQVTKKKPFSSATTGALMHFLLAVGVISYVQNYLYLIPLAIGSWIGTFLVVNRERNSK